MVVYWSRPFNLNRNISEVREWARSGDSIGTKVDRLAFAIWRQVDALCSGLQISQSISHLTTIQSDGGKARWAKLIPEKRSAEARKIVEVHWAKKRAAEVVLATTSSVKSSKRAAKKPSKSK